MPGPVAASPAIRIRKGEYIIALAWSNTATQITGTFRVLYDNGKEDDFKLFPTTLTNLRVVNLISGLQTASDNGWILSGQMQQVPGVANQATQRGQLYVKACVVSGIDAGALNLPSATIPQCKAMICTGYIYTGNELSVGQLIEPGPTGGIGHIRLMSTADPAAGLETPDIGPPSGSLWLIQSFTVQLVQGLTQTPLPSIEFEQSATQIAIIPAMTTALGASTTAQLTWGIGLVQESFTAVAGDEIYTAPLPVFYLDPSTNGLIATLTDGIGANTNYGGATLTVMEWVMPN